MESTLALATYLGTVCVVFGTFFILKHDWIEESVVRAVKRDNFLYLFASVEFLVGLLIVVLHNVWVLDVQTLITVLGWGAMIEGIAYLLLPITYLKRELLYLNRKFVYIVGGWFWIIFGVFLLGFGLGFL